VNIFLLGFLVTLISVNFAAGDNLFIGSARELKIGDFGSAQFMVDGVVYDDKLEGTISHMAPEVSNF